MTRDDIKKLVFPLLAGNMTCKELTELITDYLEGQLSFLEGVRFQMHLGTCLGCRRYLRQMRLTIRTLGAIPAEPIPPAVREELIRRFRTWKGQRT
jgi:predicted anti-sigma-YlaC factor YlaD